MTTLWGESLELRKHFDSHYAADLEQQRALFYHAMALKPSQHIVELGVCNGQTSAILALTCTYTNAYYTGIDNFSLENTARNIRNLFVTHGIWGFIIDDSTQFIGKSLDKSLWIHLLFIDAGHDEANIKPDCELWVPHVAVGGVVAFHDYDDPYDSESPHWAVRHYADKACGGDAWEKLKCPKGMAMFRRLRYENGKT